MQLKSGFYCICFKNKFQNKNKFKMLKCSGLMGKGKEMGKMGKEWEKHRMKRKVFPPYCSLFAG